MRLNFINKLVKDSFLSKSALLVLIYLNYVGEFEKTQSELGDILGLDRKTINKAIGDLCKAGYVSKVTSEYGDLRIQKIVIKGGINA